MKKNGIRKKVFCILTAAALVFGSLFPVPGESTGTVSAEEALIAQFDQPYAKPGEPLTVSVTGAPEGTELTYQWTANGENLGAQGNSYTPTTDELEKMIRVDISADGGKSSAYTLQMFFSKLPVVYINTENSAEITSKEVYVNADMTIQGSEKYQTNLYNGAIEIRGRGNSTWKYPKKPYKIKLDSSADLFGMGSSKHWVLLANYMDPSLLRNKVSYDFSGAMGMPYMQSVHVEVILNGTYLGNYQFCEQVKLEKDRVNIEGVESKIKAAAKAISRGTGVDKDRLEDAMMTDLSWITSDKVTFGGNTYTVSDYYDPIDITGGFLLELDAYDDEVSQIITATGKRVKFKDPEYAVTNNELYGYVETCLNTFEEAIQANDFHTSYHGKQVHYSELFDMESLVKFWLVQEIFFNWDGMNNSNYMYKDVGGRIFFGPVWDMDLSSGNGGMSDANTWQSYGFDYWQHPNPWYREITKDPYFIVQAYQYYHDIRNTLIEDIQTRITSLGTEMAESGQANLDRWQGGSYNSHVENFRSWMGKHIQWMDTQFASPEHLLASLGENDDDGYFPSQDIRIAVNEAGDTITVTAADAAQVKCYVNGKPAGTAAVSGGTAAFEVSGDLLVTDGSLNTVQVFEADGNGKTGKSNFITFATESETESEKETETETETESEKETETETETEPSTEKPLETEKPKETEKTEDKETEGGQKETEKPEDTGVPGRLNASKLDLQKGQTVKVLALKTTRVPGDAIVSWRSSNPKCVTVNSRTGKMTGKSTGRAVVTATLRSGGELSCQIRVIKKPVATKSFSLNKNRIVLKKGRSLRILLKNRLPLTANDTVTYRSSNAKVVEVSSKGKVKAKEKGGAAITVKTASRKTRKIRVTVK